MQVNDNIPEIIFEWLERPFELLNTTQQDQVLQYFSAEEFEEMHLAMMAIESNREKPYAAMYRIKQELMGEFDKKFSSPGKLRQLFEKTDVWKVAAVLFFLLGTWFAVGFFRPEEFMHPKTVTVTDTVYMDKNFYDTVYVPMEAEASEKRVQRQVQKTSGSESLSGNFQVKPETLNVLSLEMLDNEENVQKGNSVRDDSLISSFNFITL